MKQLFTFFMLLTSLLQCTSKPTESTTQSEAPKECYLILHEDNRGTFKNFDILIDSTSLTPESIISCAKAFRNAECQSIPCNVVTLYDNSRAYDIWTNRNDDPAWRRKNWSFLGEHDVAEYNVTVGELDIYPFMDSEYRKWGGKKKRPKPSSFNIP